MMIESELPLYKTSFEIGNQRFGLVVVDMVKGFCEVGAGNLAPVEKNEPIDRALSEVTQLARAWVDAGRPVFATIDAHQPGSKEPPYLQHCIRGTRETELMDALTWFYEDPNVTCFEKDCISGYIGAIGLDSGKNHFEDWVNAHALEGLIFVGVCTDICVCDFVLAALSARNHGLLGDVKDILVYEPGCSTYDMSRAHLGHFELSEDMHHPQMLMHHIGLKMMAFRGAKIVDKLT